MTMDEPREQNDNTTLSNQDTVHSAHGDGHDEELYDGRRKSGRVRTSTQFYQSEPIPPRNRKKRKSSVAKKKESNGVSKKAATAPAKKKNAPKRANSATASTASSNAKKKEKNENGTKTKNAEEVKKERKKPGPPARKKQPISPPTFHKIDSPYPEDILWDKLTVREFAVRFDYMCRLPSRHARNITDPNEEWSNQLFKALVLALIRIIGNDEEPVLPDTAEWLQTISTTNAESAQELWGYIAQYLDMTGLQVYTDDDFGELRYRMKLLHRLLLKVTQTDTLRGNMQDDVAESQRIHSEMCQKVKELKESWDKEAAKLEMSKPTDEGKLALWQERYAWSKRSNQNDIQKVEDGAYFQMRKCSLRTSCAGVDKHGNEYWILLTKERDISKWGTQVIVVKGDNVAHPSGSTVETTDGAKDQGRLWQVEDRDEIVKLGTWIKEQTIPVESTSKRVPPLAREVYRFAEFLKDKKM